METTLIRKTGTELYKYLLKGYDGAFQESTPSFGNLLWQLIINEAWKEADYHCFTPVNNKNGLVLGISERSKPGYYCTHVYFNKNISHKEAHKICDRLNELIFEITHDASSIIIASSMR